MKFPQTNFFSTKLLGVLIIVTVTALGTLAQSSRGLAPVPESVGLDIEQCANGPLDMPNPCNTSGANQGYGRGNLVPSKSHYREGDFVPIRVVITGITTGVEYTITVGFDFTKGGKYATDYLGNYNQTESVNNNPCVDVAGCDLSDFVVDNYPIDPQVTAGFPGPGGHPITQIPGNITCFGCSAISVGDPTVASPTTGDSSKFVTITFTAKAGEPNIVIAYGSHISTRTDWGNLNSAINISGSPYHNFVSATSIPDTNNGNRDLQLSAEAVIFPAEVRIVKLVNNLDGTFSSTFVFSFSNPDMRLDADGMFTLVDSDPTAGGGGSISKADITAFGGTNSITVTESQILGSPPRYSLTSLVCVSDPRGGTGTDNNTVSLGTRTATIVLEEGELVTCTFTNGENIITAAPANVSGRILNADGNGIPRAIVTILDVATNQMRFTRTDMRGQYMFEGLDTAAFYALSVNAKGYTFASNTQFFTLNDNLTDVDFVANP